MKLVICILIIYIEICYTEPPKLKGEDLLSAQKMLNITADIIKDTDRRVALLLTEKKQASGCASFEVGYLTYVIQEKYRRMVDKYNTSHYMRRRLYLMELIIYLGEIEHHYWEINHISNMLHEVERKYQIETELDVEYEEPTSSTGLGGTFPDLSNFNGPRKKTKKRTNFKVNKYFQNRLTSTKRSKTVKNKWWPLDYGWEIDYEWWKNDDKGHTCNTIASNSQSKENKIINELSWGTKLKILNDYKTEIVPSRRVGFSFLRMPEENPTEHVETTINDQLTTKSEDSSMKIKLFRLMYETVRDSDLKVRRAELIKAHYNNYSAFEIGFIMGDITDKSNIMTDISLTLKRLYKEWRPMEHINAYEQIANKAIEISHLIDIIRIINKRMPMPTTSLTSMLPPRYFRQK